MYAERSARTVHKPAIAAKVHPKHKAKRIFIIEVEDFGGICDKCCELCTATALRLFPHNFLETIRTNNEHIYLVFNFPAGLGSGQDLCRDLIGWLRVFQITLT